MKRAFSLVELLVVIAIIAVLAALLAPILIGAKRAAMFADDTARLRQVSIGTQLYQSDTDDKPVWQLIPVVTAGYVPPMMCASRLDFSSVGVANLNRQRSHRDKTQVSYKDSYIAVGDMHYPEFIEGKLLEMPGFGAIASFSNAMSIPYEPSVSAPSGPYLRLRIDGSIVRRIATPDVDSNGATSWTSYYPFVDGNPRLPRL